MQTRPGVAVVTCSFVGTKVTQEQGRKLKLPRSSESVTASSNITALPCNLKMHLASLA